MTRWNQWRREARRRITHRFVTRLESDLRGAFFVADITSQWDSVGKPTEGIVQSHIRSVLRDRAKAVAGQHSVDDLHAATDAVHLSIAEADVRLSPDQTILVASSLRMTADPRGLELQEHRISVARERQLHRESEAEHLASVRDSYLRDGTTARIWALSQFPEPGPRQSRVS